MFHGDDPLFHAIVQAHRDPDPLQARRFTPFSPAPRPRHAARHLLPVPARSERRPGSPFGSIRSLGVTDALASLLRAALRPISPARARQSQPCSLPGCP